MFCTIKTKQNNIDIRLNRQEITQGVFLTDNIIKVKNGNIYAYLMNTTEDELNIENL